MTVRVGGATIYSRAPAKGLWNEGDRVVRDDIVTLEALTDKIDRAWWRRFRKRLEKRLRQDRIVTRRPNSREL